MQGGEGRGGEGIGESGEDGGGDEESITPDMLLLSGSLCYHCPLHTHIHTQVLLVHITHRHIQTQIYTFLHLFKKFD